MRRCVWIAGWFAMVGAGSEAKAQTEPTPSFAPSCPRDFPPRIIQISEANPDVDFDAHKQALKTLYWELAIPNTTVLLGPDVVLDFTHANADELPIGFAACTTLTSMPGNDGPVHDVTGVVAPSPQGSARSPHALGPLVKFGPHRSDDERVLFDVNCSYQANDNVRISGFRLFGPSFGEQEDDEIGIHVVKCVNVEVSNMEIAGWGGQGVQVLDEVPGEVGRIDEPSDVKIFGNYFHHNKHGREGVFASHAGGYGAEVSHGAWAEIYRNVFDSNRHAVAAAGDMGGYDVFENLVLKGGGYHYAGFYTHQFDIHGTGNNGFGGQGGVRSLFAYNSFQYLSDNAIGIRGRPSDGIVIRDNVFAHEGLENDWGDDAIEIDDRDNLDVIDLGPNNAINFDSYGKYGVCDFDGDGIDDLFLATGQTWWFSSYGEFQWTYLATRLERLNQVRFGYFDNDQKCDVLTEDGNGQWVISSGGVGWWQSIGAFNTSLSQAAFGQFDPNLRDHRAGVTRRTSHAFRRLASGQWQVTSLAAPAWQNVQSSSFPMSSLRFGDFTGDGVTDVLAVQNGKWSISESARGPWRNLNPTLSTPVASLLIADLKNDNVDDLIRLQRVLANDVETLTWWVSDDGRAPWRKLKSYQYVGLAQYGGPSVRGFAGRFGTAPGGGVMMLDHKRIGRFHSEAEIPFVGSAEWSSVFAF